MNQFRAIGNELRRQGAVAKRTRGQHPPVPPIPLRTVATAVTGGWLLGVLSYLAVFVVLYPTVLGHLREGRIATLDRFEAAEVDITTVGPDEVRALQKTRSEDRAALVEISRIWNPSDQKVLVDLLIHSNAPAETFQALARLAVRLSGAPGRSRLVFAAADIAESEASRLVGTVDVGAFIHELLKVPVEDARRILQAGFPIIPKTSAQADLVRLILESSFSATNGRLLLELARADPGRAATVSAYLREGNPLQYCKPVACAPQAPSACFLNSGQCAAGYYPTVANVQCIPYPPGTSFAK